MKWCYMAKKTSLQRLFACLAFAVSYFYLAWCDTMTWADCSYKEHSQAYCQGLGDETCAGQNPCPPFNTIVEKGLFGTVNSDGGLTDVSLDDKLVKCVSHTICKPDANNKCTVGTSVRNYEYWMPYRTYECKDCP
jgi:hypothetical protein